MKYLVVLVSVEKHSRTRGKPGATAEYDIN